MFGENVPVPPDQIPVEVGPEIVPVRAERALFLHTEKFEPAFTIGGEVKNTIKLSLAGLHVPLFVELKIKLAKPADNSAALGVYVPFNEVLFGLNVPDAFDHTPEVVAPDSQLFLPNKFH